MVEFISTTNKKFKYFIGEEVSNEDFKIGLVIWFGDFHTSSLKKLEYITVEDGVEIRVETLNSKYVFLVKEVT